MNLVFVGDEDPLALIQRTEYVLALQTEVDYAFFNLFVNVVDFVAHLFTLDEVRLNHALLLPAALNVASDFCVVESYLSPLPLNVNDLGTVTLKCCKQIMKVATLLHK